MRCLESDPHNRKLLSGTCDAHGINEIYDLEYDGDVTSLRIGSVYSYGGQIWDLCSLDRDHREVVAVAERSVNESSVVLLDLTLAQVKEVSNASATISHSLPQKTGVQSETRILGKVKALSMCEENLLVTTTCDVSTMGIDNKQLSSVVSNNFAKSMEQCEIVHAVYNECKRAVLIAFSQSVYLRDPRSPGAEMFRVFGQHKPPLVQQTSNGSEEGQGKSERSSDTRSSISHSTGIRPARSVQQLTTPHLSTIATNGDAVLACGAEDGGVFALDLRRIGSEQCDPIWSACGASAHAHYVTSLAVEPSGFVASGGTDGVVRVWNTSGEIAGTYPIHDDTVYGLSWLSFEDGFASVSYDGRLAANALPADLQPQRSGSSSP